MRSFKIQIDQHSAVEKGVRGMGYVMWRQAAGINRRRTIIYASILLAIIYWIADAAVDSAFFHGGPYWSALFTSSLPDNWMRMLNLVMILGFGIFGQHLVNRLRAAEAQYRLFFEGSPRPMLVYDLETLCFLAVNDSAVSHYGYSRAEFLAMTIKDIHTPDLRSLVEEAVRKPVGTHKKPVIWRQVTKEGQVIDVEMISHNVIFEGKKAGLVLIQDITERKIGEEKLRVFRQLMDQSKDAIFVSDPETSSILDVNEQACRSLGYAREELLGMKIIDIEQLMEGDISRWKAHIEKRRKKDNSIIEGRHVRKDGVAFPVEVTGSYLATEQGEYVLSIACDVTDRRRSEEMLRASEKRYRDLFDSSKDGIYQTNANGIFTLINSAGAEILGHKSPKEVIGKPAEDYWLEARDSDAYMAGLREKKYVLSYLLQGKRADGEKADMELTSRIVEDEYGNFLGVEGILRDVTERKRAEDLLRESERNFRNLFESSVDAIFVLDMDGYVIDINKTAYERLGYIREEMLAMNVKKLDPPEYASRVAQRMSQIKEQGSAIFETAHYRKDGTVMPVEVNARLLDYKGQTVYFSIVRDITERKKSEEDVARLFNAVARGKEEWEKTFDSASELIALVDATHRIIKCNRSFAEFAGRPVEVVPGSYCFDFLPYDPERVESCKGGTGNNSGVARYEVQTDTGKWFYLSFCPVMDERGEFVSSVVTATDISALKITEKRLLESQKELKKRVADLEKFYDMAVGRELRMKELKKEIKRLNNELQHSVKECV